MEVAERDEQLRILKAKLHRTICECGRNIDALQECEGNVHISFVSIHFVIKCKKYLWSLFLFLLAWIMLST